MSRTFADATAQAEYEGIELVAYPLGGYIDDFTGYVRESELRSAVECPFHPGGYCTPEHRDDDLRRLRGLIDAIRLGGPLRHEPYVASGSGMTHILVLKEDVNGLTYVAGHRDEVEIRFRDDALSDDSHIAVLQVW